MPLPETLRIVFMGTPEFAVPSLERLVEEGHPPIAVVTGPDRRRGRGQQVSETPVKRAARAANLAPILQPESVKDPAFADALAALNPDLFVVVAFRILPESVLAISTRGAFNLHGSLLPKYRGAAPIHRAVMAGEKETGVTTFFLERKVDTGNMILRRSMPVGPDETTGEVHDRMMRLGAEAVVETVRRIADGTVTVSMQDDAQATPAPKVFREDGLIDWGLPAETVHNHIRGLSPFPGAWTRHRGVELKVYRSRLASGSGEPGTVLEATDQLVVACGTGAVALLDVQQEGRKRLPAAAFLRGYAVEEGEMFY